MAFKTTVKDSRRYISRTGVTEGPFTVDEIFTMAMAGETNMHSLFWSESKQAWKPLVGLMLDVDPERIDEFIEAGVKRVRVLGSGSQDCYVCAALADKTFPIGRSPLLPPEGCRCVPWCRLVLAAVQDPTDPSTNPE